MSPSSQRPSNWWSLHSRARPPTKSVDLEKKTGLISVFHWVQQVDKEEDANCVLSDFKYQSVVTIPCLKNKDKISAGVQLTFCKPKDPEAEVAEPPQKKKRA